MVTGDNVITATAIAREAGILDDAIEDDKAENFTILEGKKFR